MKRTSLLRILLIEDNEADSRLLQEALRASGLPCQVSVAEDGDQALGVAGGPIPATAKAHSIYLLRPRSEDPANPTIYRLTIGELLDGADVGLAAGDRLYVPPTELAAWNRTTWAFLLLPIVLTIGLLTRYN